ncbi:alpha/beta hydrolase [Sphingomonas sp. PL-96]|uniref:alpha/beta hydrolase n=1 Tax=Sphingomonas sp. PL-96 TaxID=2887201 RepID=UPI001E3F8212|nr:alpha/beta hydrolase [Sphingomonas sp. PL-96]MCC2978242.1 alpha/beta hydrolase [Sphingomonas sp. PL-96]
MSERARPAGRMGRWLLRGLLILVAAIVLAIVALKLVSMAAGESLRSYALREIFLPAMNAKQGMIDERSFTRSFAEQQKAGSAPPSDELRAHYAVSKSVVDGRTVYTVVPRQGGNRRRIVYLHGGAYIGPMSSLQWSIVSGLAERTGATVIVPDYGLAPRHSWRDGYALMDRVYGGLLSRSRPQDVILSGDSAGGGFALGFALWLKDQRKPLPAGLVLFSPWLNLTLHNPAQEALDDRDPILARPALNYGARLWAAGLPLEDPRISPVLGSLSGLPPIFVASGTADLLHADALQLLQRGRAAGVGLDYDEGRNQTHAWSIVPMPEAERLYDRAAGFINTAVPLRARLLCKDQPGGSPDAGEHGR